MASTNRRVDLFAATAGAVRLASGLSFLVAPDDANRLWGDDEDSGPTASLLLRSMGWRDALIGGTSDQQRLRGWAGRPSASPSAWWARPGPAGGLASPDTI
jgi:hypothetical protein